jgi:hypothetical protein
MSQPFLSKIMRVAKQVTRAERAMAVDSNLDVLETLNLDTSVMESQNFQEVATSTLRRAIERGEPIITNNIITDPSQAPVTNTNFTDLRVVVVIPVEGDGAVYVDQHIRYGIIPRQTIDKLMRLVVHLVEHQQQNIDESEMIALYQQLA